MSYSDKVIDHYNNPRNVGSLDKSSTDVGTGLVGAPECGDVMKLQIKVNRETNVIEEAKFKTFGCGSAIASSSLATEWVKGKTVDEALSIIQRCEDLWAAVATARASKAQKRHLIAKNYEKFFVTIGNRDGFKCAKCGVVKDLHIDHIVPLALDGSNDLDNLQLLCKTCNLSKGTSIVDYRS